MKPWLPSFLAALTFSLATSAFAQRQPHIGYVYPAGGQRGTTFVVTFGGQSLDGVTNVIVSGTGIKATVLNHERQVTPQEQDTLAKRLNQIREKRQAGARLTATEEKLADEIRTKLTRFGRQLANPGLNQFVTLRVTLAREAETGKREVRLGTTIGLSNPLVFCVGDLSEIRKRDWKNVPKSRESLDPERDPSPMEMKVTTPAVLNGQLQPGGVDRYRFKARSGQPLTVMVSARELLPYLADAVPGWLQTVLTLTDAAGNSVPCEESDRYAHPDPTLFCAIPRDGEYVLEIKDSLYRGREDFVYRITVGELPFVTGIFPLGGQAGTQIKVAFRGRNLPQPQFALDLQRLAPGLHAMVVSNTAGRSRSQPFAVDTLPECSERETNHFLTNSQPLTLPVIVNGRIATPGEVDVFRFEGRAGEKIIAEVLARRLDSPLDSFLKLADATGRQLAFNDDHEDKGAGLNTHHADSYLAFTLPQDGDYFLQLGDTQHGGSENHAYRLRLSQPRPDFELRVVPSSLNARGGASVPLTVFALRKDGFHGEISLALMDAPAGFALAGATVPAGRDLVKLTLTVPPVPGGKPLNLRLEGSAVIEGRPVLRKAVPADDLMQAFAYRHLVPAQELKVMVGGNHPSALPTKILTPAPIKIPCGQTARLEVRLATNPGMGNIRLELDGAPDGITIESFKTDGLNTIITIRADADRIKPGYQGNLIIQAFAERAPESQNNKAQMGKGGIPLGALPAVPFKTVSL